MVMTDPIADFLTRIRNANQAKHSVYRKFKLCRVCFRQLAHRGQIPGVTKASW